MTKVIILSDETSDEYYERTVLHLHEKFHTCPTNLGGNPASEAQAAQISYYDAMAREMAARSSKMRSRYLGFNGDRWSRDASQAGCTPPGKMVF